MYCNRSITKNYAVDPFKQSVSLEAGNFGSLQILLNKYFDYDAIPKAN